MVYLKFINWLKWKLAGDEISELCHLKRRTREVAVWCSPDKKAIAISDYLLNCKDYPYQSKGAHGDIADFRGYLKTLD